MTMGWSNVSLFLSGLFFGGMVDHLFLALRKSTVTPYGYRWGVKGNWVLASLDAMLTVLFYVFYRLY